MRLALLRHDTSAGMTGMTSTPIIVGRGTTVQVIRNSVVPGWYLCSIQGYSGLTCIHEDDLELLDETGKA